MDVHLLVYDLSQGMARSLSLGLLGFQLDMIYHTSIKLGGREYVYDGGIVAIRPGSSHLGPPLDEIFLGRTEKKMDAIADHLQTLRRRFTIEAYDLWNHNCNHFSNTFAQYLVGTSIPSHVLGMPDLVRQTPLGQMLVPMMERQVGAMRQQGGILGIQNDSQNDHDASASPTSSSARTASHRHPHEYLHLPTFNTAATPKPVSYTKLPNMPKLLEKIGPDAAAHPAVKSIKHYLEARERSGPAAAHLPDMAGFAAFVRESIGRLPPELLFGVVDLLRCGLVDPRFSGWFAAEKGQADSEGGGRTVVMLLDYTTNQLGPSSCPYALRLVALHMACNLFLDPVFVKQVMASDRSSSKNSSQASRLRRLIMELMSASFLDGGHVSVRVTAASLLFNVALANGVGRRDGSGDVLPEDDQIELLAPALEAIKQEDRSVEALEGLLRALGYLAFRLPLDFMLADVLRTMDSADTVLGKKKAFPGLGLVDEVGRELLGKGLRTA